MASKAGQSVTVDGHLIKVSNLDKQLYPQTQTTKGEVLAYYAEVAAVMIPHVADRPATRKRWPDGVGTAESAGPVFFQKNLDSHAPDWVERRVIEHRDRDVTYPLVNDVATLVWLAQLAALEIHVPQWRFGREQQTHPSSRRDGGIHNPDRLVIDLDPGPGVGLPECVQVAQWTREILTGMGLDPVPVTSGSKGIHLYAGLDETQTCEVVSAMAHELARSLEADHPELVVSDMSRARRDRKVLVDWSQNSSAKTTVAPYSLRGRLRPWVAVPRSWDELDDPDLHQLELEEVLARVRAHRDPSTAILPARPVQVSAATDDLLATYRSKRNADKTPEPVPEHGSADADGRSFVIQEHHASSLHWDFRLEHDGVLVSWALPKGPPDDPKKNHLAVQTEDHPLEYGSFEGAIPKGEYGGAEVTIWDAGTYELEKWRPGKEVIATLTGRPDGGLGGGPRKFALIHTGGDGRADKNWLIHAMKIVKSAVSPPRTGQPTGTRPEYEPMLATLATRSDIDDEHGWAYEMKWDGVRALACLDHGSVRLVSRTGQDMTAMYPELVEPIAALPADTAILDGEIVALDSQGRPEFALLQRRINLTKAADIEAGRAKTPVRFLAFDLLELDGASMIKKEYHSRRDALLDLVPVTGGSVVQAPPGFDGDLDAALATSVELELEGVVAKRSSSTYLPGRRGGTWLKIKHHRTQEVVVGGWKDGNGRRAGTIGSLLVGVFDGERLCYVGGVGTGFTDAMLEAITSKVARLARTTCPFDDVPSSDARNAHWLTPSLVGEVKFSNWTDDGRMRHPSWRGWRPDKTATDVARE